MKNVLSITEARKRLPSIIKTLKTSPDTVYQITVHDEVVAEIRPASKIDPGAAAARLLDLRERLRKPKRKKKPFSENIKEYLYVAEGKD